MTDRLPRPMRSRRKKEPNARSSPLKGCFSLSKKSACGGLFRQMLKKCLRQGAQTPRPPGKAGRYEFTLEGLRALQASRKVFLTV